MDDAVAAVAVTSTLEAPISLLVYSTNRVKLNCSLSLQPTHLLETIGAETVTVPVSMIDDLAAQREVTYVAPDVPLGATEAVADAEWVATANAWMTNIAPAVSGAAWAWRRGYHGKSVADYKVASNGNGWSGKGWSGNGWAGNGWSGNRWSWFQGTP